MKYTNFLISSAADFPQCRSGSLFPNESPTFYRLRYVPPYDSFNEIKKIQLLAHRKARENAQSTLVIDVTEWGDHTDEEYFVTTLRFLFDYADTYQPQFLITSTSEKQIQRMLGQLNCYFTVQCVRDLCFEDISQTRKYLTEHCRIAEETAMNMARQIIRTDFPHSYMHLNNLVDELNSASKGGKITKHTLEQLSTMASPITATLLTTMTALERAE